MCIAEHKTKQLQREKKRTNFSQFYYVSRIATKTFRFTHCQKPFKYLKDKFTIYTFVFFVCRLTSVLPCPSCLSPALLSCWIRGTHGAHGFQLASTLCEIHFGVLQSTKFAFLRAGRQEGSSRHISVDGVDDDGCAATGAVQMSSDGRLTHSDRYDTNSASVLLVRPRPSFDEVK